MVLLQISEPGQTPDPHEKRVTVGIDLGTTNSLLAKVVDGKPSIIETTQGSAMLPSVVYYASNERIITGETAFQYQANEPNNVITSVKRLMGRGFDELGSDGERYTFSQRTDETTVPKIQTEFGSVTAVEVSAEILKTLKQMAENTCDANSIDAVITVPAYFDDSQRQATKDAATLAGLNVLRLINEPTAAAIAYGLDKNSQGIVAVYDLGGGTFDISILKIHEGVFEVLSTSGDTKLGGDDFDAAVVEYLVSKFSLVDLSRHFRRRIEMAVRVAKETLTDEMQATIRFQCDDGKTCECVLTRENFNDLIEPLVKKTLTPCRRALLDAGLTQSEISAVVLVGGSSRVPYLQEQVNHFFAQECLTDIDPDQVVALGAAIQGELLSGRRLSQDVLLLDVIPLSLGIETMGGLVEKIIQRNSTIPTTKAQEFTTFKDGQTAMMIHVLQGERELIQDCRSLAKFELKGIPPMVAGAARIVVTFQVDADGLLSVSAKEKTTQIETTVSVKPSSGLTEDEIARMLADSMQYAHEDMESRRLKEQQTEAARVIEALEAALAQDGEQLLNDNELQAITTAKDKLVRLNGSENYLDIKHAIEDLEHVSKVYVAKRVDLGINKVLSGQHLDHLSD